MASGKITSLHEDELAPHLIREIEVIANDAIASRGQFLLGLSGASMINLLSGDNGLPSLKADWKKWKIFLCDERIVPESDPESTGGLYKAQLFPNIPEFPLENFLAANVSLSTSLEVAKDYEKRLREFWPAGSLTEGVADCLLLGVGPDGHTCSLFPKHEVLDINDSWVTFIEDSPKPPPKRITLTFAFINKAVNVFIVGMGEQKIEIANKIIGGEDLPIGRVNNPGGRLEWFIGSKSAGRK